MRMIHSEIKSIVFDANNISMQIHFTIFANDKNNISKISLEKSPRKSLTVVSFSLNFLASTVGNVIQEQSDSNACCCQFVDGLCDR